MLAYVFWHRPGREADAAAYEAALARFHAVLAAEPPEGFVSSHSYARAALPWFHGYEDWYLVADWTAVGVLNAAAVDSAHKAIHDDVALRSRAGTAGIYRLVEGEPIIAASATWSDPPVTGDAVWRRQMVLGPSPEFVAHFAQTGGEIERTPV